MTDLKKPDLTALGETVEAVRKDPAAAKLTVSMAGEWAGEFRLNSSTGVLRQGSVTDDSRVGRFSLTSDEPTSLLGSDSAVSPARSGPPRSGCW